MVKTREIEVPKTTVPFHLHGARRRPKWASPAMRILVAPDKFKGSLSAPAAARAIVRGWKEAWPECDLVEAPIADGGEGFAEVFQHALGGEWIEVPAQDALGRPIQARYRLGPCAAARGHRNERGLGAVATAAQRAVAVGGEYLGHGAAHARGD